MGTADRRVEAAANMMDEAATDEAAAYMMVVVGKWVETVANRVGCTAGNLEGSAGDSAADFVLRLSSMPRSHAQSPLAFSGWLRYTSARHDSGR